MAAGGPGGDGQQSEDGGPQRAGGGTGGDGDTPLVLSAPDHDGGHLDWYSFDLAQASFVRGVSRGLTSLPVPVRYSGMPASRWWELESDDVNFGDLDAGPADLPRLLIANFATLYGNDWFVFPLAVPVGSLTEVEAVEVIDTFGDRHQIRSTALLDSDGGGDGRSGDDRRGGGRTDVARPVGDGSRPWRFFELAGDQVSKSHPSPWLLVAPTLVTDVNGPPLEQVELARDEGANLAWAIERSVEGPLGRAVERASAWHAANPPPWGPGASASGPDATRDYASQAWRYRLERPVPPWWIPLVPEPIADTAQVVLRRARMSAWDLLRNGPGWAQVRAPGHISGSPRGMPLRRPRGAARGRHPRAPLADRPLA